MKSEKRIPTILGVVLLLVTIYGASFLVNRTTSTSTKASGECEPVNPQVTNITYNTATISFTTSSNCLATVNISNRVFVDSKEKGTVHYFEAVALEESKAYEFTIISDGKNYTSDSFNFKTAKKPTKNIPTSNLAWGRVLTPEGKSATNAIVYFSIPNASALSALVNSSGNWNIALSTSFNESLNDWFTPPASVEENITVIAPSYNQTQIVSNTSRNNPVPDIILGQNNFSVLPIIETTDTGDSESRLDSNYDLTSDTALKISNPENNENVSSKRPDFFGTAQPKSTIKIKVESPVTITDDVEVEGDGSWNWSPSQDLAAGEHTITVTDENNKTVSHKFIVLAAESTTSFTASSSAVTKTPTPTITIKPTNTPIPTQIPVIKPSTSSGVPRSGNYLPTLVLISFSLIFGIFAFIYYKKI